MERVVSAALPVPQVQGSPELRRNVGFAEIKYRGTSLDFVLVRTLPISASNYADLCNFLASGRTKSGSAASVSDDNPESNVTGTRSMG